MKTKLLFFLSLALFISKAKATETEPNNTKAQASTLALNSIDIGKIEYAGDIDWWKVTTNADGELDITVSALNNQDIGVNVYIYDKDGKTQLGQTGSASTPGTSKMDGLAAGTYYIRVSCGYATDTTFYSLTDSLIAVSPANDIEPNGMVSQAKLLPLNGTRTGHIGYKYNNIRDLADWYKVTANADGQLDITLTVDYGSDYGTGNHGVSAWLVDGDKTTILNSGAGNPSGTFKTDGLAPGTYYIKVFSSYADEFASYTISDSLEKTAYKDIEPNNYALQADSLPVNKTKKGHVGYRYNGSVDLNDWYKITTTSGGLLKVTLAMLNGQGMLMTLYQSDTTTIIAQNYSFSPFSVSTDNLPAGTYYVKVSAYYYAGYMNYTINDSLFTHSLAAMNSIAANRSNTTVNNALQNITTLYPNPVSSQLNIHLDNETKRGEKTMLVLKDINGKPVWKEETTTASSTITADVSRLPNGMYFLQVMSSDKIITTQKISVLH